MEHNIFNESQYTDIQSNIFDLSHEHKTSFRFGKIYPVSITEVLPGDNFQFSTNKLLRFMPLISPVMHRIKIVEHWFFVPNRLTWSKWESFITNSESGIDPPVISWVNPARVPINLQTQQTLGAYFGLPYLATSSDQFLVNAMPLAAYCLIWNEYYRDQNVQDAITVNLNDGINISTLDNTGDIGYDYGFGPLRKSWKKDYFTSALPAAQKGTPVQLPLTNTDNQVIRRIVTGTGTPPAFVNWTNNTEPAGTFTNTGGVAVGGSNVSYNPQGSLVVDINADAVTMNTFRAALALQAFLEKDNTGGAKYTETIRAHFNATPPDFRLQRPEYLGGSVQNMIISEVLSQSETLNESVLTPLGQMAGHGASLASSDVNSYYAQEHGYIICMVIIEPDLNYNNVGMHKMWDQRLTREDYAWPAFAHLGEQAILNRELVATHADPAATFGYTPRYSEYKYHINYVTGEMAHTLQFWHLGLTMPNNVALNGDFLTVNDEEYNLTRIFAVDPADGGELPEITDYIIAQIYIDMTVNRKLPRFAVPKLVG